MLIHEELKEAEERIMKKLVLIRHGESVWNKENRFTGWVDVELSPKGLEEASEAGRTLRNKGFEFDVAYTSLLKRAIKTLWLVLEEMDHMWIPVHRTWHLNERHYGLLQGLNKIETVEKHGEKQVHVWRRSYDIRPPALGSNDPNFPGHDPRYKALAIQQIPATECLKDVVNRFLPYWQSTIAPAIEKGERVLIAAHGNSIRALVMYLDEISEDKITDLNIPTGIPLVYELEDGLRPIRHYYLGDPETIERATQAVANQTTRKSSPSPTP